MTPHLKTASGILLLLLLGACQTSDVADISRMKVRPAASLPMVEAKAGTYYDQGKSYLASSDYGLAIDAFRQSLRYEGDRHAALNGLAITYDMLGRYDLSQRYYDQALEIAPQSPVTLSNLAYSQYLQGRQENAVKLAAAAENLLSGKTAGQALALSRAVSGNMNLARNAANRVPASPKLLETAQTAIVRMGHRTWEVTKSVIMPVRLNPARESDLPVDTIIANALQIKREVEPEQQAANPAVLLSEEASVAVKVAETPATAAPGPAHKSADHPVYRILNGAGRRHMARRMTHFMQSQGLTVWSYANAEHFNEDKSFIAFAPGQRQRAEEMAALLPYFVKLVEADNLQADVVLTLGADFATFDTTLPANLLKPRQIS